MFTVENPESTERENKKKTQQPTMWVTHKIITCNTGKRLSILPPAQPHYVEQDN